MSMQRLDELSASHRKIADALITSGELRVQGLSNGDQPEDGEVGGHADGSAAHDVGHGDVTKMLVPVFSTAVSFATYICTCPADLNELGLCARPCTRGSTAQPPTASPPTPIVRARPSL